VPRYRLLIANIFDISSAIDYFGEENNESEVEKKDTRVLPGVTM